VRSVSIEDRVRDYIASERQQIAVPAFLPQRILRAVATSQPIKPSSRLGVLRVPAAMVAMLILGFAIASIRVGSSPASVVQGSWSSAPSMAVARGSQTATLLPNGKVLVVGGSQAIRAVASAELFDPKTRSWQAAGSLDAPRWGHTATLLRNGKVLIVGGNQGPGDELEPLSSAELYDPRTNSWSLTAPMHTPRAFHSATLLADGRVLVAGGHTFWGDAGGTLVSTELYDPVSDSWSRGPDMKTPRAQHAAVLLADGRLLAIGGTSGVGVGEASGEWRTAEIYDPSTNSWAYAASMQYGRVLPSANLLPDGRVLVSGDDGINYRTAELYDPTRDRWSMVPNGGFGRAESATAQLRDGNVLVAGGIGEMSSQVFDWRSNKWQSAGDLTTLRASATATLLPDGRVLVAGGFGRLVTPWTSAELYDPNGRRLISAPRPTTAGAPVTGFGIVLGAAALLIGLGAWTLYRRNARDSAADRDWISAD
jgi:N-acetylneuraminic acid mutarotase